MFDIDEFKNAIKIHEEMLENKSLFTAFMRDLFVGSDKEINLLVMAYSNGICRTLDKAKVVDEVLFHRLVSQLENIFGISKENALWTVDTWIYAFDKEKNYTVIVPTEDITKSKNNVKECFFTNEHYMYYNDEVIVENKYGRFGCLYWNFKTGTYGWLNPLDDESRVESFVNGYKRFAPHEIKRDGNVVTTDTPPMRIQFKNDADAIQYKEIMEVFKMGDYEIDYRLGEDFFMFQYEEAYENMKEKVFPLLKGNHILSVPFKANVSQYKYDGATSNLERYGDMELLLSVKRNNKGLFGEHKLNEIDKKAQDENRFYISHECLTGAFNIVEKGKDISWEEVCLKRHDEINQNYLIFEARGLFLTERLDGYIPAFYDCQKKKIYWGDGNEYICFDFGTDEYSFLFVAAYITLIGDYSTYLEFKR